MLEGHARGEVVLPGRSPMAHRLVKVGNRQQLRQIGVGVTLATFPEKLPGRQ
jgi:hypothetical protein